jgi:hypothetical protein
MRKALFTFLGPLLTIATIIGNSVRTLGPEQSSAADVGRTATDAGSATESSRLG